MCARLDWNMHLHELRHYSATELIAAGVDLRTVAGRCSAAGWSERDPGGGEDPRDERPLAGGVGAELLGVQSGGACLTC